MIVTKQGDWIAARVRDEVVMMSAEQGEYIGLNEVGARIWDLIDAPVAVESLCDRLIAEFEVEPDTCRAEVDAFLAKLVEHHAARLDRPAG